MLEHPVIRVGIDNGWPPVEYADEEGNHRGIAADFLSLLSERLGFQTEVITDRLWSQVLDGAKNGEIDFICCLVETPERLEYLSYTRPYYDAPSGVFMQQSASEIVRLRDLVGRRVAVVEGYAEQEMLTRDYPELQLVPVSNAETGMRRVSTGKVDAFVEAEAIGTYLIREKRIGNVKLALSTSYSYHLAMGVRKDLLPLVAILDKGIRTITQEERDEIHDRWVVAGPGSAFGRISGLVGFALAGLAIVITATLMWRRRVRRS
jgi:ABC-type amino acid transport substrate-binding protein